MKRILVLLQIFIVTSIFAVVIPKPDTYVGDYANTIDPAYRDKINSFIVDYKAKTSIEICVITIKSLEGDEIMNVAQETFTKLGIGKSQLNNGILVLIAKDDRKMRIHTGYGVEPILTDAKCENILNTIMRPNFRNNDFGKGIYDALVEMTNIMGSSKEDIQMKLDYEKKQAEQRSQAVGDFFLTFLYIIIFGIFAAIITFLIIMRVKIVKEYNELLRKAEDQYKEFAKVSHTDSDILLSINDVENKYRELYDKFKSKRKSKKNIAAFNDEMETAKSYLRKYEQLLDKFKQKAQYKKALEENVDLLSTMDSNHPHLTIRKDIENAKQIDKTIPKDFNNLRLKASSCDSAVIAIKKSIAKYNEMKAFILTADVKVTRLFEQYGSVIKQIEEKGYRYDKKSFPSIPSYISKLKTNINMVDSFTVYTNLLSEISTIESAISNANSKLTSIIDAQKTVSAWPSMIESHVRKMKLEDVESRYINDWKKFATTTKLPGDALEAAALIGTLIQQANKHIKNRQDELAEIERKKREERRRREEEEEEDRRRRNSYSSNSYSTGSYSGSSDSGSSFGGGSSGGGGSDSSW